MTNDTAFGIVPGQRQLFLDDLGIAKIQNLERSMHRPEKKGAVIRPDPNDPEVPSLQIRTAPIWDPDQKTWKLWDCITPNDLHAKGLYCSGYYESGDGLHWQKPVVGQVERGGSLENNYVAIHTDKGRFGTPLVVYDPTDSDLARRYKGAIPNVGFIISPDGLNWKMLDVPGVRSADEFNFSFDEQDHLFILTVKHGGPYGRSVWLSTSTDFEQWTEPELIFHADEADQELGRENIARRFADPALQQPFYNIPETYNVDVYNMGVFRYESLYIGMPAMFHRTGKVQGDWPGFADWEMSPEILETYRRDGDWSGFHQIQLTSSRDLRHWQRLGNRQPFIDSSPLNAGAYDLATIIGPSYPIVRGEELWFYYTGIKQYGGPPVAGVDRDRGAICLAVLRRDGFISVNAGPEGGTLLTKPFSFTGRKLCVNIDARKGEIRAEVVDTKGEAVAASVPLKGDLPRGELRWQHRNIDSLKGQVVSLRFTLKSANFYSYWLEE